MSRKDKSRSQYQSKHRGAAHAAAHAAEDQGPTQLPEHALIPRGKPWIVSSDVALEELIQHIREAGGFAYDSEFIGELTYVPKLCLVQVATAQRVALVDPLAGFDLTALWDLVADPTVEKIVHSGQQDVEPVVRLLGKRPVRVFDTQIAAGFVGLAYPTSLSKLALEILGVKLAKGFTFTQWDSRPLSPVQLRYAADDVRFLPAVRAELGQQLAANGRAAWAVAECDQMCDPAKFGFDPATAYQRVRGVGGLGPLALAVLRELVNWREPAAAAAKLPTRTFVADQVLIDMSRTMPKRLEDLERVRGLPRPVEHQHGQEILDAVQRGQQVPPDQRPEKEANDDSAADRFRLESLWSLAQACCFGQQLDPALVASRSEVVELYRRLRDGEPADDLRIMRDWRKQALGDMLVGAFHEGRPVNLTWLNDGLRVSR